MALNVTPEEIAYLYPIQNGPSRIREAYAEGLEFKTLNEVGRYLGVRSAEYHQVRSTHGTAKKTDERAGGSIE